MNKNFTKFVIVMAAAFVLMLMAPAESRSLYAPGTFSAPAREKGTIYLRFHRGDRVALPGSKAVSKKTVPAKAPTKKAPAEVVIKVTAKKFEYKPNVITLKKGVPAVIELTSLDRKHGFNCPGLHVRADIIPGKVSRVRITPGKAGKYEFHCDLFCGSGHEDMTGTIIVTDK